jgi:hypothetical protein
LLRRIYAEGHEIGNHTFLHPDISNVSKTYMKVELNLTERLFAGVLGIKTALFRPPYSVDQEPDTADQVRPLEITQQLGYLTIGDKIDPNDWRDNPHLTAEQITEAVVAQLGNGNVILLHDGGGDRSQTVRAIPMIVRTLRARGYKIVPVSELLGKSRDEVMPAVKGADRFWAKVDWVGFLLAGLVNAFIVGVFFIGDILMTGRLIGVGPLPSSIASGAGCAGRLKNFQLSRRMWPYWCRPSTKRKSSSAPSRRFSTRTTRIYMSSSSTMDRRNSHLRGGEGNIRQADCGRPGDSLGPSRTAQSPCTELRPGTCDGRDLRRNRCRYDHRARCNQLTWFQTLLIQDWELLPGNAKVGNRSISGHAGRRWNTSQARISSAAR